MLLPEWATGPARESNLKGGFSNNEKGYAPEESILQLFFKVYFVVCKVFNQGLSCMRSHTPR